jgi:hypothetical protein
MAKQFPDVSSRYGAPMGRSTSPLDCAPRSVRLFRVRLDAGGYDDGGVYWGHGGALWCAVCDAGGRQFVRAAGRLSAVAELGIERTSLKRPPLKEYARLRELENRGNLGASGVILRQKLQELGF